MTAPDLDRPMAEHRVCLACHPLPVPLGTPALCGALLLGVRPRPGSPQCGDCQRIRRGVFPCGHGPE